MRDVPIGAKGSFSLVVGPEHLASSFKDPMLPPVFSTPVMVMAMENAALNALRPYFEPHESAVGTLVNIRHLAASPVGAQVRAEAEVTGVDGRRISFAISARDDTQEIGTGTHERVVIDLDRFRKRFGRA